MGVDICDWLDFSLHRRTSHDASKASYASLQHCTNRNVVHWRFEGVLPLEWFKIRFVLRNTYGL